MTVRGLLHVLLAVLALATFATPAQANPSCVGTVLCASEEPCVGFLCLPDTSVMLRSCTFAVCPPEPAFCDRAACLNSPSHCDPITFGDIDEWSIDTSCLLPRWPPMPPPMPNGDPTWVFDLLPDLP